MKLEIERSGTIAWSPSGQFPNLLASGTVAGSLDVDFDTSAHLEIFQVDFSKGEMNVIGRASANDRFNRICWGQTGIQNGVYPKGLLAGGLNNGTVNIWDASKIIGNLNEEEDQSALIASCERHASGQSVQGLDFNPYQYNLLASGGSDSEIFIWDLQNPQNPTVYNPGAKQQVYQDSGITCLQWNRKVQHILGSVNYSGVTVVWDLKAKKAVLNFSSPNRKLRCKAFAWNPDEATQVITASEDDGAPILELWDLRNTYSPAKTFEGHTRGIWSVSWCPMDSDLLLSCGKDNRTLCWNVKTGEILSEVEHNSSTWNFDVQWSPKIPAILSTCSLERKITLHSLQDVRGTSDKSFAVQGTQQKLATSHAPKWLKRPVGVSFGFGGKIVWFKKPKANDPRNVHMTQVVTDKEFLGRADHLQQALSQGDLKTYCDEKIAASTNEEEKSAWSLMRLLFETTPRSQLLQYLGFNPEEISEEVKQFVSKLPGGPSLEKPKEQPKEEEQQQQEENSDENSFFETIASKPEAVPKPVPESIPFEFVTEGAEGMITKALIVGNFEAAVETCIRSDRMADALILAAYGGSELWKKTQEAYFNQKPKPFMKVVSSIIKDELRAVVENADLQQWKTVIAVICTYAKRDEFAVLCSLLGDRLLHEAKNEKAATEAYICAGNIDKLLQIWEKESSQENSLQSLQNLIEKISVFRKVVNHQQPLHETIARKYSEYAQLLAGQGKLDSAAQCLSFLTEAKYEDTTTFPFILLDRLYHSSKGKSIPTPPPFPFQKQEVSGQVARAPAPVAAKPAPTATSFPGSQAATSPFPGSQTATAPFPGSQTATAPFPGSQTATAPFPGSTAPFPGSTTPRGNTTAFPQPTSTPSPFPQPTSVPSPFPTPSGTATFPTSSAPAPFPAPAKTAPFPSATTPFPSATTPFPQPTSAPSPFPQPSSTSAFPPSATPFPGTNSPAPFPAPSKTAPPPATTPFPGNPGTPPTAPASVSTPTPAPKAPEPKAPVATSPENESLIQLLQQILQQISASSDPKVSKYAKDVVKRFEPMISQLVKNEFSKDITLNMSNLCQAILAGDSRGAQDIHVKITQQHWEELGSNIMIGLKRLVDITKA